MNRGSTVLFFKDLYKTLNVLPDEEAGALMRALFAVANNEDPNLPEGSMAAAVFPLALDQMARLEEYRNKQAQRRAKTKVNQREPEVTKGEPERTEKNRTRTESEPNGSPYPSPYPSPVYIGRSNKIQERYGFSTERKDVDYNELARMIREAEERQAQ